MIIEGLSEFVAVAKYYIRLFLEIIPIRRGCLEFIRRFPRCEYMYLFINWILNCLYYCFGLDTLVLLRNFILKCKIQELTT